MKRFLLLVLVLTLCFIGCKEEIPEKPIEETKAPVENIEVPEIEEPHEETPTEPEVEEPVEVIPTEPEVEEPLDENTIVLPEPDENTKIITIEFPKDFPEEPYTEPELVSPEEFEWGEYVPFVRLNGIQALDASSYVYDFAILSKEAKDLPEARELYARLNNKYLLENPAKDYDFYEEKISDYPEVVKFLYKSRIELVTADLSKMLRVSYVEDGGSEDSPVWFARKWNTRCDLIENGEIKKTIVTDDPLSYMASAEEFNFEEKVYLKQGKKINTDFGNVDLDKKYYLHEEDGMYTLYSLDDARLLYQVSLPKHCYIEDYGEDYFLLQFFGDTNDNTAVYLYDINKEEFYYMESLAYNSKISPDKKYFAYTSDDYDGIPKFSKEKRGFYIKNLENNTTVFYPYVYEFYTYLYIKSWILKECLF